MSYAVTLYTLDEGGAVTGVDVDYVRGDALPAYTDAPGMALAAARRVGGRPRPDGFRIVDDQDRIVFDYVERAGPG